MDTLTNMGRLVVSLVYGFLTGYAAYDWLHPPALVVGLITGFAYLFVMACTGIMWITLRTK